MSGSHRRVTLSLWLVAMAVCGWLALTHAPVSTDLDAFMPAGGEAAELISGLRAGPAQQLILMGIAGSTAAARAAVSVALAERLRKTDFFTRVANGQDSSNAAEQQLLFSRRYLLSPAVSAERFTAEALRDALQARLRELRSPVPVTDTQSLAADPTREFYTVLRAWEGGKRPAARLGVWFAPDGQYALLLAETKASGLDLDAQSEIVAAIEAAFEAASQAHPATTLALSGPPVFATTAQATIRRTVTRLSVAASLAAALILVLAYRSWRVLLLAILPLGSAMLVAVATSSLVFGEVFGITLAFGMTLLGVAMDYPVHLFSHRAPDETAVLTLRRIWPILRLGVISTALGYLAMITTDLRGLQQLGVFAVVGLLTAAAVTRWVLPSLLPAAWVPKHAGSGAWMDAWIRPRRWVVTLLVAICAATLILTVVAAPPMWEDDLATLSPIPAKALAVDQELRLALGAPDAGHVALISAPDAQTALRHSEALAAKLGRAIDRGLLGGFDMAARYLPSERMQRERQAALPPHAELEARLAPALEGLPFKPGAFEPFLEDVKAARAGAPLQLGEITDTALGARVRSLLFEHDGGWLALVPLSDVNDPDQLAVWFARNATGVKYVDLQTMTRRLMAHFRDTGLVRAGWGALLIVALLAVGLRSLRQVVAAVMPVALAVVFTVCALLALESGGLTLFHIVSLLLVVGICIDYSLFFGHTAQDSCRHRRTLHAVLVCAGSTLAVFVMLAASSIPVLRAIGLTVTIGVGASFFLASGLAPQLAGTKRGEIDD